MSTEQMVMINQPMEKVLTALGDRTGKPERLVEWVDPVICKSLRLWGRQLQLRYSLYGIPGGTQVTATILEQGRIRLDPIRRLVLRAARRHLAANLDQFRRELE